MARELGLFAEHGLAVELVREVGWAAIRARFVQGDLDAAHALAAMPFAATLGIGSAPYPSLTALVLNLQGNAITIARSYQNEGVADAASFGAFVRRRESSGPLVFGVVSRASSHRHLMERWLEQAGLLPERHYRLVVVPPPQLPGLLRVGVLAGYCAGEPWNSAAVAGRIGWCPATSADLAPGHPEKVLLASERLVRQQPEEHLRLVAAVLEACRYCAEPGHHAEIAEALAARHYVNASADLIRRSFGTCFESGLGGMESPGPFTVYHAGDSNCPTFERGIWALSTLRPTSLSGAGPGQADAVLVGRVFREDLFRDAGRLQRTPQLIPDNVLPYENTSDLATALSCS